jgi:hypothetical protein
MKTGAILDPTGIYRYLLWREWEPGGRRIAFVMLNPSTADATTNDPTIRRCIGFARSWGFGALDVVNLFAYRATYPLELRNAADPVGPENDQYILDASKRADVVLLAWGNHGTLLDRDREVLRLLSGRRDLLCLNVTNAGQPRHPLYAHSAIILVPFSLPCRSKDFQLMISGTGSPA